MIGGKVKHVFVSQKVRPTPIQDAAMLLRGLSEPWSMLKELPAVVADTISFPFGKDESLKEFAARLTS